MGNCVKGTGDWFLWNLGGEFRLRSHWLHLAPVFWIFSTTLANHSPKMRQLLHLWTDDTPTKIFDWACVCILVDTLKGGVVGRSLAVKKTNGFLSVPFILALPKLLHVASSLPTLTYNSPSLRRDRRDPIYGPIHFFEERVVVWLFIRSVDLNSREDLIQH